MGEKKLFFYLRILQKSWGGSEVVGEGMRGTREGMRLRGGGSKVPDKWGWGP